MGYPTDLQFVEKGNFSVKTIEHTTIPLSDGTKLAAKIWRPDTEKEQFPAILEMIPYRKRDVEAWQDSLTNPYFAAHGYACVRVDLRGAGESDGVLEDEYLPQEQKDGLEVLKWIADQQWCDGNIGMIGISWGGFNGLQFAALQPPELKTIITACSTDDRYADDIHYMGGTLLCDHLSWASVMFAYNSCPPDPELVGDKWKKMWLDRLEGSGLWLEKWLNHQTRDAYWKHGSICEDYSDIKVPVYAVSGWADGYSNAVFRMMQNLNVPRKGLVGPWSHKYPHVGVPGPAIGFLQDALRWWDKWLKNIDTGVENDPLLTVWMQDSAKPATAYTHRPGRWVTENAWLSSRIYSKKYNLTDRHLIATDQEGCYEEETLTLQSPLSVGLYGGKWCTYSAVPDMPYDQREDDGGSLTFDTTPLNEHIEIMGAPELDLTFSCDKPVAQVAIRLSDINEQNEATRVTFGLLNLTHRNSHEHPEELEPGKKYRVKVDMNEIAQKFPAGHRIRLSISTSYWPIAWPAPEPFSLKVYLKESTFTLPVRPKENEDEQPEPFGPAEGATPVEKTEIEPGEHNWLIKRDLAKDETTTEIIKDEGIQRFEHHGLEMEDRAWEYYSFQKNDPASVRGEVKSIRGFKRGDWHARAITHTVLRSDSEFFLIDAEIAAYEGNEKIYTQTWNKKIPRNLM